jgi:hypothetical protein
LTEISWNSRRKPDFWLPCRFELFLGMAGRYKQPVWYGKESAHKSRAARSHSSLGDYMFETTSTRRRTWSSAGPGRSQQLEIPPSLNSKRATCFSSSASFSMDTSILPGARILPSAWFSPGARILPSAWFSLAARILLSAWFSLAARILLSAWFSLAASILHIFLSAYILDYFSAFLLSMRQYSDWHNYFRPLGVRLCIVVMIIYCVYDYY